MLIRSASPVTVTPELPGVSGEKLTVLTAASEKEVASWDEKARHGMFTHHLLDALYGKGDLDGDGEVTAVEVKTYLDDTMTIAARVEFGRYQNASLKGLTGAVLARARAGGAFPLRPVLGEDEAGTGTGAGTAVGGPADDATEASLRPEELAAGREVALGLVRVDRVLAQRGLATLGFNVGPADGKFGPRTRGAVRAYQEVSGTPVTGFLTREEFDALAAAVADTERRETARRAEEARMAEEARLERRRLVEEEEQRAEEEARRAEDELRARERLEAEERLREKERREEGAAYALAVELDTIRGLRAVPARVSAGPLPR